MIVSFPFGSVDILKKLTNICHMGIKALVEKRYNMEW
jgi:hypothetical protein